MSALLSAPVSSAICWPLRTHSIGLDQAVHCRRLTKDEVREGEQVGHTSPCDENHIHFAQAGRHANREGVSVIDVARRASGVETIGEGMDTELMECLAPCGALTLALAPHLNAMTPLSSSGVLPYTTESASAACAHSKSASDRGSLISSKTNAHRRPLLARWR